MPLVSKLQLGLFLTAVAVICSIGFTRQYVRNNLPMPQSDPQFEKQKMPLELEVESLETGQVIVDTTENAIGNNWNAFVQNWNPNAHGEKPWSIVRGNTAPMQGKQLLVSKLFESVLSADDTRRVFLQVNNGGGIMPVYPGPPYCLDKLDINVGNGNVISSDVSSSISGSNSLSEETCGNSNSARLAADHTVEARFCIGAPNDVVPVRHVQGYEEFMLVCPNDKNLVRLTIECLGATWLGATGRAKCVRNFSDIVSSLIKS